MSEALKERVRTLLATVVDPHTGQDLVTGGALKGVGVDRDRVSVDLVLGYPAASFHGELMGMVRDVLEADPGISIATVSIATRITAHRVQKELTPLPNVKNIIAVASGKGGVG